jgi:hypothetical protein
MTTRADVERAAQALGDERHRLWISCLSHDVSVLHLTDTGEVYCGRCCSLWTPGGELLNEPAPPKVEQR